MNYYIDLTNQLLNKIGCPEYDPRHVLSYIMLEHGTLSNMDKRTWVKEIFIGMACVDEGGLINAEKCARSFGL